LILLQVIDDLRQNLHTYQQHADVEREKFEGKMLALMDQQAQARDNMVVCSLMDVFVLYEGNIICTNV